MNEITLQPIAMLHSCYSDKFGIPRQPGLVKSATARLELLPPFNTVEAIRGIEDFSHLWVLFFFHETADQNQKLTVRPPRLGGNQRLGVFATRSNFRPNPIGLSVVELEKVVGTTLHLRGGDFLDQTPVLDIKPYVPYSDCHPTAYGSFAHHAPEPECRVAFSEQAEKAVVQFENSDRPHLRKLVTDMLSFRPQPAYQNVDPDRRYGTTVFDLNIRWTQKGALVLVEEIVKREMG